MTLANGVAFANAFVKEHLAKIYKFSNKMAFFLVKSYLYRILSAQIPNQRPKIDPCSKFLPNWTKDKGCQRFTSNDSKNCMITSHTRDSDDVMKTFNAFERFCAKIAQLE